MYDGNDFLGFLVAYLNVEGIDVGICLEQHDLAFHDGFCCQGTAVAKSQQRTAVADDGHQVALVGVAVGLPTLLADGYCRCCHTGSVCQGQLLWVANGLGGDGGCLARLAGAVVFEGSAFEKIVHVFLLFQQPRRHFVCTALLFRSKNVSSRYNPLYIVWRIYWSC